MGNGYICKLNEAWCWSDQSAPAQIMALILGGNSEMGAHARNNICYLICYLYICKLNEAWYWSDQSAPTHIMALILGGNSELSAHVRSNIYYLILRAQHVRSHHLI